MLRLAGRLARKRVGELLAREEWFLAFSREAGIPNGAGLEYLFPPKDRYWADPFPVRWNGKTHVFLEEVPRETMRGHISVMTLQEGGRWGKPVKVLERDYHLSYPFLFRWENDWYLIPESAGNSTVELYRCVSFPAEWRLERVLLQGEKLYDVTLREIGGRWWMFASMAVGGALEWDELHLFHADSPLGPWRPHRRNPVKSDVRSSRPAGSLFEWQGSLCRPAQDCSRRYGYAISVNRILRIDTEEYREVEVSRILPGWDDSVLGVHTLNMIDGTFRANVAGTANLLEAVRAGAPAARVLVVGSGEAYGPQPEGTRVGEDAPFAPVSPYAESKAEADRLAAATAEGEGGLDVVRVRAFSHTGPGQSPVFVVPGWAQQIAATEAGRAEPVLRVGNLEVTRDLQTMGLKNTFLAGYFYPGAQLLKRFSTTANQRKDVTTDPDVYNQTTPAEMGMLLGDIYQCAETGGGTFAAVFPGEITQSECRQMINYLTLNRMPMLTAAGLPEGTQIAHKHGWVTELDGLLHSMADAGIIFTPGGNYILTVFVYQPTQLVFEPANQMVAELSRAIYNYFNPPAGQ